MNKSRSDLLRIPASFVEQYRVLPLREEGGVVIVGHAKGLAPAVIEDLSLLVGQPLRGEVLEEERLDELIRHTYGVGAKAMESVVLSKEAEESLLRDPLRLFTEELAEGSDAAIVAFVNKLMVQAFREGATDVHLEPFEEEFRVRFRTDGFLHEVPLPRGIERFHQAIVARIKVMAHLDIAEHRLPQDGRIRARLEGEELDFRISVLPTRHGEGVNVRILSNTSILRGMETLGLLPSERKIIHELLDRPNGVVLVTGPTGSGKTTTLYSFLSQLNEPHRKILTIEDPIEYRLDGVTQIQVHPKIGLTFARGLRSMLRHDPDVMMVGEIRDQETAETAIRVALTGHLVFSTVHTNDAASAPARILNMGIEPYLVASSVECIIAQRLVRLLCRDCSEPVESPTPAALVLSSEVYAKVTGTAGGFRGNRGCSACRQTGYKGRTALFEILLMNDRLSDLVVERAPSPRLAREAVSQGFWPLRWRGLAMAAQGQTTVEEVLRVTPQPVLI